MKPSKVLSSPKVYKNHTCILMKGVLNGSCYYKQAKKRRRIGS